MFFAGRRVFKSTPPQANPKGLLKEMQMEKVQERMREDIEEPEQITTQESNMASRNVLAKVQWRRKPARHRRRNIKKGKRVKKPKKPRAQDQPRKMEKASQLLADQVSPCQIGVLSDTITPKTK
ncbi:uncharacterized protein N7498_000564 [Penicillium cinerascens]|uniref:Uncharacterized protein n=1 Tax=Penicillium cinerascens TaxID=70096 RepID=A0A9W9TEB9_9EURO|nr:uncharacterized protein N7498_000564 [Penicillium cinerascens]KAJ5218465.1 hypothetical protein N7498_000564 [Penicillium cinerascens]